MSIERSETFQLESSSVSDSKELIRMLWNFPLEGRKLFNGDAVTELCHSAYHEYYLCQWGLIAGLSDGKFVALKTPGILNQLVQEMQNNKSRAELLEWVQGMSADDALEEACEKCEKQENSLNLAVRLLLMLRIGDVKYQLLPRHCLKWQEGSPRDLIHGRFGEAPILSAHGVKLPKTFNGWSLKTIGGIKIRFTDNLDDHLRLIDDGEMVLIFHYASFLECHRLRGEESLFPPGFAEETLRTLSLLFPQSMVNSTRNSRATRSSWFRKLCERQTSSKIDERLGRCGNLSAEDRQIERFKFWRDRLVILKQAYDEKIPETPSQFWYDRRNRMHWCTFWVAILVVVMTAIYGLVQCIETGYQTWHS